MWAWLAFPVLARVLMASQEADQFGSKSSLHPDMVIEEDVGGGGLLQENMKPDTDSKSHEVEWRQGLHYSPIYGYVRPYENSISSLIRDLSSSGPKIYPNIPEDQKEERNKRSPMKITRYREPTGSWVSWISLENKALQSRSHQEPWKEIKKSRAFSPWGGKRIGVFGQGGKVQRPIRVPFNSWGGKRGFPDDEKRSFSSWGGKRDWSIGPEENYGDNGAQKRTKFNAWGGKRNKNGERRDDEEVKRTRFNAWGGKRNFNNAKRMPEEVEAKKSIFNAWGGKRSFTSIESTNEDEWDEKEDTTSHLDKQIEKIEVEGANDSVADIEEKGDWDEIGLAESGIIKFPKKKLSGVDNGHKNLLFNPWGGKKRSPRYDEFWTEFDSILPSSNDIQGHQLHGRFWPWGG